MEKTFTVSGLCDNVECSTDEFTIITAFPNRVVCPDCGQPAFIFDWLAGVIFNWLEGPING